MLCQKTYKNLILPGNNYESLHESRFTSTVAKVQMILTFHILNLEWPTLIKSNLSSVGHNHLYANVLISLYTSPQHT